MDVIPKDPVQAIIFGSHDGLDDNDRHYVRRRANELTRNLKRKYAFLGKATGDRRTVTSRLNLEEGRLRIEFNREAYGDFNTEAVLDVDITLLKPRTRKELAISGLERDPDAPKRVVSIQGKIYRYDVDKTLKINDLRIKKIPTSGTELFNKMLEAGFIHHPRSGNYMPLFDEDITLEPLGRRQERKIARREVPIITDTQDTFIRHAIRALRNNFEERFNHIFNSVSFSVNTNKKSIDMSFEVTPEFAGKGHNRFSIQTNFNLVWRNKGGKGTSITMAISGGLSRKFQAAAQTIEPMKLVEKNRGPISDRIFDVLVLSGKISAQHDTPKPKRAKKLSPSERKNEHSRNRAKRRTEEHRLKMTL